MTNVVFLLFPGSQSRNLDLIKHPESQGYWDLFNKKRESERVTLFHQKDQILLTFKPSQGLPGSSWHPPAWKTADCLVFPSQLWVELHKKQVLLVNQRICNRWICPICGWVSNQCQMWTQISCLLVVYWNIPSSRLWCKLEAGAEPQSDPLCGHYACYLSASLWLKTAFYETKALWLNSSYACGLICWPKDLVSFELFCKI